MLFRIATFMPPEREVVLQRGPMVFGRIDAGTVTPNITASDGWTGMRFPSYRRLLLSFEQ